ncbi:hypothetical protein SK128_026011 [Halocaridina rubra]|uniref:CUB domain-containing protein n=1 Tax=Halocaridina rubra TaxID=373956 RepID=A0AAN8ZWF1_HALRR
MPIYFLIAATLPPTTSTCNGHQDIPSTAGTLMVVSSGSYSSSVNCSWRLTAPTNYKITFTWNMFQTEQCCDKVGLKDESTNAWIGG